MKLLGRTIKTLLVLCVTFWVIASGSQDPPPVCNATLLLSSEISSSLEGSGSVNLRSLSPWKWSSTTVKNQIPTTIWEATCSSEFCSSPKPGQADNHNWNSVPIYQKVLVLTRMQGSRCYTTSYRSVPVGCTCVKAVTEQN